MNEINRKPAYTYTVTELASTRQHQKTGRPSRAGIPGFAHATAEKKEEKTALTRERTKKNKSTKTPPKNNKNTKKHPPKKKIALTRKKKPLA